MSHWATRFSAGDPALAKEIVALKESISRDLEKMTSKFSSSSRTATIPADDNDDECRREVTLRFAGLDTSDLMIAGDFNDWVPDKGVKTASGNGVITKTFSPDHEWQLAGGSDQSGPCHQRVWRNELDTECRRRG